MQVSTPAKTALGLLRRLGRKEPLRPRQARPNAICPCRPVSADLCHTSRAGPSPRSLAPAAEGTETFRGANMDMDMDMVDMDICRTQEKSGMRMVRRGTFTVAPPGEFLPPPHYSSLGPGHRARAAGRGPIQCAGGGPIRRAAACLRWDLYARPVGDALRLELQAARAHLEADRALSAARGTGFLGHRHGSAAWHARTWVVEKGQPRCCRPWGGANAWAARTLGVRRAPLSWVQAAVLGAHPWLSVAESE